MEVEEPSAVDGSKKPEAGSQKQAAGSTQPPANSQEPAALSNEQTTGSWEQQAKTQEPAAGNEPPASDIQHPASSIQHLASGFQHLAPTIELFLAAAAGALWYLQGGWVWYNGSWPGPWPLVLLGLMWISRLSRSVGTAEGRRQLRPSTFTAPLVLFIGTAAVAFWAAYDPAIALAKVWLIVGALGLYWAMAGQPDLPRIYVALTVWAGFCILLTTYFLVTNDWTAHPLKIPALTTLGEAIAARLPSLAAHSIHPNVVGGLLAVTLPLTVPLVSLLGRGKVPGLGGKRHLLFGAVGLMSLVVGMLGILLTVSRGAWMALIVAAALWGLGCLLARTHARRPRLIVATVVAAGTIVASGLIWLIVNDTFAAALSPVAGTVLARLLSSAQVALTDRLRLLQLGALLVRDTPFTGIGLGMFEMHFSIYVLLIHVGYLEHSHNLLLDLAIEQGLVGPIAYVALVVTAVAGRRKLEARNQMLDAGYSMLDTGSWKPEAGSEKPETGSREPDAGRRKVEVGSQKLDGDLPLITSNGELGTNSPQLETRNSRLTTDLLRRAALAAIAVTLVHGLVDDPLYGSRGLLLLFVPFGLLAAIEHLRVPDSRAKAPGAGAWSRPNVGEQEGLADPLAASNLPLTRRPARSPATAGKAARALWPAIALALLLAGGVLGLQSALGKTVRSMWLADLGAVAQARVELNVYDQAHFGDPTISMVRRDENLSQAIALFQRARALNPTDPTACQRLTEIALARGDYAAGLATMQALWDAGPADPSQRDRVSRMLYGDALVDAGRVEEAVDVVQGLEFARDRILGQAWTREYENGDPVRAAYARQAAELLGH